jgi:hypothetical protein
MSVGDGVHGEASARRNLPSLAQIAYANQSTTLCIACKSLAPTGSPP